MRTSRFLLPAAVVVILFGTACTHADGNFQKTFAVNGAPDVDINNATGNVTVRTGDVNSVQVSANIEVFALSPDFVVEHLEKNPPLTQSGNHIRIGSRNGYSDFLRQVQIHYTVTVPPNTKINGGVGTGNFEVSGIQGHLVASTGTGDVRVEDFTGEARLSVGTGDIEGDHADGNLMMETGTGSIHLRASKATRAQVGTGTGDISLDSVQGELLAHTGTGNITVSGTPTSNWRVDTGTGDIAFHAESSAAYRLEAHGSIGRVNLGSSAQNVRNEEDRRSLYAEVGSGGPKVELRTGTGDIDIN